VRRQRREREKERARARGAEVEERTQSAGRARKGKAGASKGGKGDVTRESEKGRWVLYHPIKRGCECCVWRWTHPRVNALEPLRTDDFSSHSRSPRSRFSRSLSAADFTLSSALLSLSFSLPLPLSLSLSLSLLLSLSLARSLAVSFSSGAPTDSARCLHSWT